MAFYSDDFINPFLIVCWIIKVNRSFKCFKLWTSRKPLACQDGTSSVSDSNWARATLTRESSHTKQKSSASKSSTLNQPTNLNYSGSEINYIPILVFFHTIIIWIHTKLGIAINKTLNKLAFWSISAKSWQLGCRALFI